MFATPPPQKIKNFRFVIVLSSWNRFSTTYFELMHFLDALKKTTN